MKFRLIAFILIFLLENRVCSAQTQQQYPILSEKSNKFKYLLITSKDFAGSTLVDAERILPAGKEQLSIINIDVPLAKIAKGRFSMSTKLVSISSMLITFAIIPDKVDKQVHWQPIQLDTLPTSQRVVTETFIDTCFQRLARYHRMSGRIMQDNFITRSASIKPIIYRDGSYWTTSNYTLTEVFLVCPISFVFPFQGDNVTINTLSQPYPSFLLEEEWNLENNFHLERSINTAELLASKVILEKKIDENTYDFHTFGTNTVDASDFYTGAGDFRYQKGIGLISGSYSLYMLPNSLPNAPRFITKRISLIK